MSFPVRITFKVHSGNRFSDMEITQLLDVEATGDGYHIEHDWEWFTREKGKNVTHIIATGPTLAQACASYIAQRLGAKE